jgi:hypothetical protein
MSISITRTYKYAKQLVDKYQVDCRGLTVLTEAASGAYLYNPMIAILAGASRVITFSQNSRYGNIIEIEKMMDETYRQVGLAGEYEFVSRLKTADIASADIITNSGHLRPFDKNFIEKMKLTAVIPLMWEPWEIRSGEISLDAAKQKGILIMGTNEHQAPCDMRPYSFLTALHMLMAHQSAIKDDRILIIGRQYTLGQAIEDGFNRMGIQCKCIAADADSEIVSSALDWATYILVAEHKDQRLLIGPHGLIPTSRLLDTRITGIGVMAGLIDRVDIEKNLISVYPDIIAPPGYMSYLPSELGPYAVMDLFAAGLKVGQVMANARISGMGVSDAAHYTLENSPAMDLDGEFSWI